MKTDILMFESTLKSFYEYTCNACGIQIVTFEKQYNDVNVISAEGY